MAARRYIVGLVMFTTAALAAHPIIPHEGVHEALAQAASYLQPFTGAPSAPAPAQTPGWDFVVHSRDPGTWQTLQSMDMQHGPDCSPPTSPPPTAPQWFAPAVVHQDTSYGGAVFQCRDHIMTAIRADGYGLVYLTPDRLVDFSAGEAVVRWRMSTLRTSSRDWVDLWVTPYEDNLIHPLENGLSNVDLQGGPRRGLHLRMDNSSGTIFRAYRYDPDPSTGAIVERGIATAWWMPWHSFLAQDAARRDLFELRISRARIQFGMPEYNRWWIHPTAAGSATGAIADLGFDRGVVQLGHHSYSPMKDCSASSYCKPNTWHWDDVSIDPAVPFTIAGSGRRSVGPSDAATPLTFSAPAPAGAHLRFSATTGVNPCACSIELSFDGGSTWQPAQYQPSSRPNGLKFRNGWHPIPAGAQSVLVRGVGTTGWMTKDWSVWSQ